MIGLAARKESEVQFREEEGGKGFFFFPLAQQACQLNQRESMGTNQMISSHV